MGKSWKDSPEAKRDLAIKRAERGERHKMNPYVRAKNKSWDNQE